VLVIARLLDFIETGPGAELQEMLSALAVTPMLIKSVQGQLLASVCFLHSDIFEHADTFYKNTFLLLGQSNV
jgi:hypothetical protein